MTTLDIIKLVLQAIAVLISGGILIWARKKYNHFKKNRDTAKNLQFEILEKALADLKVIRHQVLPNGGSSLNDKVSDIATHLGEIDKTLLDLKVRQRNSSEICDVASWESDKDGKVEYVSTALCDLLGRTASSLADYRWTAYLHPEDRDRVTKEWSDSVKSAGDFNSVYRYMKSDGSTQKVHAKAVHNTDKNGKVINSLGRLVKIDK